MKHVRVHYLILVIMAIIFSSTPALGYYMGHNADYFMDGIINMDKQAGHFCNTGAEMKQRISGKGYMIKYSTVFMQKGFLQVVDNNDWTTAPDALENLTVTTAIMLCSAPKYVYGEDGIPVAVELLYPLLYQGLGGVMTPLSSQMIATSISVEPGYTGRLHTGFDAAHGPFAGAFFLPWGDIFYFPADRDEWRFVIGDEERATNYEWGPDYVGDYFTLKQYASTNHGMTRRFIDVSSPWSHGYLNEGLVVAGSATISEALSIRNLVPEAALIDWWRKLF